MGQRLKRWESPRRQGRNDKGKGGSARQRQLKKRQQMLRQKLHNCSPPDGSLGGCRSSGEDLTLGLLLLFGSL